MHSKRGWKGYGGRGRKELPFEQREKRDVVDEASVHPSRQCRHEKDFCSLARKKTFLWRECIQTYMTEIKKLSDAVRGQKDSRDDTIQQAPCTLEPCAYTSTRCRSRNRLCPPAWSFRRPGICLRRKNASTKNEQEDIHAQSVIGIDNTPFWIYKIIHWRTPCTKFKSQNGVTA